MTAATLARRRAEILRGRWSYASAHGCAYCGLKVTVALEGCDGTDTVSVYHADCSDPKGRPWRVEAARWVPTPGLALVPSRPSVPRGQYEATVTRGMNLLWALAYSTGKVFTEADWRKTAEQQGVPPDVMRIAVHRAIRNDWIEALDLVDGKVDLEPHDRRKTRFVSRIHRPRRAAR